MSISEVVRVDCDGDGCNDDLEFCGPSDHETVRRDITNWYGWTFEEDTEQDVTRDYCPDCSAKRGKR